MSGEWQPEERENYPGGYDWSKRCVLSPERNLARVMDRRGPGDELVIWDRMKSCEYDQEWIPTALE